jgi:DNA-binding NtrC family response regulator
MSAKPNILVVDDDATACKILARMLRSNYQVTVFDDSEAALQHFTTQGAEIIITDLKMPKMDGMALLSRARQIDPKVIVFVITGFSSVNSAVEAMRRGAYDYIPKPYEPDEVLIRIKRSLKERALEARCDSFAEERKLRDSQYRILTGHPKMHELLELAQKVARTDSAILVQGETGVGKELLVRMIHQWSPRNDYPFVPVNCSALAEGVMESELFGHEKGAFTGATTRKIGFFEMANHGTILLDEIGTTDSLFQVKLLRVLQDHIIYRVGSPAAIAVDVRVIAATNQDLEQEARQGLFRSDLYYRLGVVTLTIPPLRDRMADIPLLAEHFLKKYHQFNPKIETISPQSMQILQGYGYPGNVRELENIIERAMILESATTLSPESLLIRSNTPESTESSAPAFTIHSAEKEHILQVLELCSGKKMETARMLGINKTTLWRKLKKYGLGDGER